jgi:hypothetical protein
MTPLQIVEARAPEYEGHPRIETLLQLAEAQTANTTAWGGQRNTAVALLVLHWLAMQERGVGGAPGPVTSESEGSVSRSYGWSGKYGALSTTSWGLELQALRKQCFIGARNGML